MAMRGVGGPLLCIGDLLSDVGEGDQHPVTGGFNQPSHPDNDLVPSHLIQLFQENYDRLDKALVGSDQSWTALTLKLCASLETGNKLVAFTNSHVGSLLEKVGKLERIIKQRDSAVEAAKAVQGSLEQNVVIPHQSA